ncbi:hypothetical protein HCY52_07965 [Acinetobacter radioresistens]|uniref:DUF4116 domain-containing protein n=1 Tax=Acinetobacter radioresistens TaxID=40216 RepID=UPI0020056F96|nr:DUF4116 domain-containing protein [Acinetobacter radioresistens]MCK4083750.1 hypothetical protein [Acinetobacter radioresistens]
MKYEDLIREDGILLKFINREGRSYELCLVAVENNPKAIRYVPPEIVDDAILELVFDAGESYIKMIPQESMTDYAITTIKYQYPHIAIEKGIAPLISDGGAEREYLDDDYFDCLFNQGDKVLLNLPTEYLTPYAVEKIKATYPKLACDMDLMDVVLDQESLQTYYHALDIINGEVSL